MRSLIVASALVLASAVGAQAADLIFRTPSTIAPPPVPDTSIYLQLLGGVSFGNDVDVYYNDTLDGTGDSDTGYAIAGTLGVVVLDGLSLELDVLHTNRDVSDGSDSNAFTSTSFMANAKYTVGLSDGVSLYGAAGLGYIGLDGTYGGNAYTAGGFGYQLIGGGAVQVADNMAIVGELRYQNTFEDLEIDDTTGYTVKAPTTTALVGLKFSF